MTTVPDVVDAREVRCGLSSQATATAPCMARDAPINTPTPSPCLQRHPQMDGSRHSPGRLEGATSRCSGVKQQPAAPLAPAELQARLAQELAEAGKAAATGLHCAGPRAPDAAANLHLHAHREVLKAHLVGLPAGGKQAALLSAIIWGLDQGEPRRAAKH